MAERPIGSDISMPLDQKELTIPIRSVEPASQQKIYSVGSLHYTLFGLLTLSLWLLWADFCMVVMESIVPKMFPLFFKDLGASNTMIGIMVGSVPGVFNLTITPLVCIWSDRYRSIWGRRIPFLFVTGMLTGLLLIAIGFTERLGVSLNAAVLSKFITTSPVIVSLVLLCVLVASFHLFNSLMVVLYNCLLADVVPRQVIGRFMAGMRTVSLAGKIIFSRYIFGLSGEHRQEVYLGVGLFFLTAFLLMCWRIKEGQYPPTQAPAQQPGLRVAIKGYIRECFSSPYYLCLFLGLMFIAMTSCVIPFLTLFYRDTLGLTLDNIGKLQSWIYLIQAVICIPFGFFCDRVQPLLACIVGLAYMALVHFISYFLIHDWNSLVLYSLISVPGPIIYGIGAGAMVVILLPKEKYGQFSSASSVLTAIGLIGGNFLTGKIIDLSNNYRLSYFLAGIVCGLAIIPLCYVYQVWKKHGGPDESVPSEVKADTQSEPTT